MIQLCVYTLYSVYTPMYEGFVVTIPRWVYYIGSLAWLYMADI
jgi:hypothetical protein